MAEPLMAVGDWLGRRALCTPEKEGLVVMPAAQRAGAGAPGAAPLRLTFAQWNRRANRMAHWLWSRGVTKGDRVGVLAHNCTEMLDLLFACGKLGAIFVPFNWRLSQRELEVVLADSEPRLLLYGPQFGPLATVQSLPLLALESEAAAYDEGPPPAVAVGLEDPWMLLYTGGTTGRPKGAVITHRQVTWNAWNTIAGWGLSPEDRAPVLTPFFHTGGLNVLLTPLVQLGGTSILMGPFQPDQVLEAVKRERISILFMVPTMFQILMEQPEFTGADFSGIRFMISGGAPCPQPIVEAYWAKGVPLKLGYGMTEVGPNCFSMPDWAVRSKPGSVGHPIFHATMRIVDGDRECGPGEVGELQIAGPHLCGGYWRNPEASHGANPDGWFRTGDLARRDAEGFYYIVDRQKDMFISGGENVYPAEVEAVLYQHPAVAEAVVVGMPDPKWGEVGRAVVVLRPGAQVGEEELLAHCRGALARYKVPKQIEFRAALPKSAAGKILRRELRQATPAGTNLPSRT